MFSFICRINIENYLCVYMYIYTYTCMFVGAMKVDGRHLREKEKNLKGKGSKGNGSQVT